VVREKAELAKLQAHIESVEVERILTTAKQTISQKLSGDKPAAIQLEGWHFFFLAISVHK
jgi:hypothetical protein